MFKNTNLIIDFDSTFIRGESFEMLAEISLQNFNKNKRNEIIHKLNKITEQGMQGVIPFEKSLQERFSLFQPTLQDVDDLINKLHYSVTPSFLRNRVYLKQFSSQIYIVSGGFIEYMKPVLAPFGILKTHIFGNSLIIQNGEITSYDKINPLSHSGGKATIVESLKLKNRVVMLGDGYTDFEVFKKNVVPEFIVFTENTRRSDIVKRATFEAKNFEEVISYLSA